MKKYGDVKEIYEIVNIEDECALVKIDNLKYFLYYFKVKPIIALNKKDKYFTDILSKYEEFLRFTNLDINIIINHKEISLNDYISFNVDESDTLKSNLKKEYMQSIDKIMDNDTFYTYEYYLIFKSESKLSDIESYINIFQNIGIEVVFITGKNNICEILRKGVE